MKSSKIIGIPPVGKMVLEILKKRAFKSNQIPIGKALEKQGKLLEVKFKKMETTEIGRKLGVHKGLQLQSLQITDYSFYEPFFNNPTPSAFMYPLEDYLRVRTSGTTGKEKWFLIPQQAIKNSFRRTGLLALLASFHNGEKINLEYGDVAYVNVSPRPFLGGTILSSSGDVGFIKIVPNFDLSYRDKVSYFISNYEKIDAATLHASTLISQIMPAIGKPISLKGVSVRDSQVGEMYKEKIKDFVGCYPKTSYGSTETLICSFSSVQHPLGFIFDWREGITEFKPIKNNTPMDELIGMDEVKVGGTYELVFTSFDTEITRLDTNDAFSCVAMGDNVLGIDYPVFKFEGRTDKVLSVQNFARVTEDELIKVFKNASISFVEFTAKTEIENGLEHLAIYVEVYQEDLPVEEVKEQVHKQLCKIDQDYKELVDFFEYVPLKIHLMPKGVFSKYVQERPGMPRVDRINMVDEEFRKLLKLMKEKG